MKFDLSKAGKIIGRQYQRAMASEVLVQTRVAPGRSRPTPGGSLPARIRSPGLLRVGPWGFSVLLSQLGTDLSRFTMGNKRQRPRPITAPLPVRQFVNMALTEAVKQMEQRDREVR